MAFCVHSLIFIYIHVITVVIVYCQMWIFHRTWANSSVCESTVRKKTFGQPCTHFLKNTYTHFDQSSKRTDRHVLMSMENFLLDGAANPSPVPLLLKSTLRAWARSNSPRSPCCSCCCASFPRAMFAPPVLPAAGWKPFLKPPINRRNFCCCSELSNWAEPHWPKPWGTETFIRNKVH